MEIASGEKGANPALVLKMYLTPYMHTRFICCCTGDLLMVPKTAMPTRPKCPPCTFSRNMFPRKMARVIATIFLLCASLTVKAQVESGKIVGTVRDPSGAVVTNAAVKVAETQTNS